MEQAGAQPQPEKPDRPRQRRLAREQDARLAPDVAPGASGDARERPGDQRPRPQPSPKSEPCGAEGVWQTAHPVVIGYDGSKASRNALAYAAGLARRLGQPLLVVYVVPFGVYCEPITGQVVYPMRDRAELEPWLLRELDESCDWQGLDVSIMTRRGNAARELAAAADSINADALVVGAPGHRLHHIAGSIPGWLARHARCPVIVVP
jgi:nucleotide-binding universal stress UspA family protein